MTVSEHPDSLPLGTRPVFGAELDTARALVTAALVGDFEELPRIGRYALLSRLGEGGMGAVYTAYDEQLDRRIAIKLLHDRHDGNETRARLMREAQALAKLSHPNVVVIYEVGEHKGRVFLAMELVKGRTLGAWVRARAPSWREILAAYLQAGRGLAAAHAAGLVHRDFKPDNAMIDDDAVGRVRVLDFGLARSEQGGEAPSRAPATSVPARLTSTGAVMGTPAYMAPEQFLHARTDARADQFSFCVALHEALYGVRPFAGRDRIELVANVTEGRVVDEPRDVDAPRAIRAVLLRGLAVDPEQRWPDLDALLAQLDRFLARPRRTGVIVASTLGGLVAVASVGWLAVREEQPCAHADEAVASTWNTGTRESLQAAMLAVDRPFVTEAWPRVESEIDGYADALSAQRRATCEATQVRGEQSAALMDARIACLDARQRELDATITTLTSGDVDTFVRADRLLDALPELGRCADRTFVEARTPLPTHPDARARVEQAQQLTALTRANAAAGRVHDAELGAKLLADFVPDLEHAPTEADARLALADVHQAAGDFPAAEREASSAYFVAYAAGDDELAMRATLSLYFVIGDRQQRFADAKGWEAHAEAAVERSGSDRERAQLRLFQASVWNDEGRIDEAMAAATESAGLAQQSDGDRSLGRARALGELAISLDLQGRSDEALASLGEAREILEARLGPDHPLIANAYNNLGGSLAAKGRIEEAKAAFERALEIRERAYGPDHVEVGQSLANLGTLLYELGDYEHADAHLRRAADVQSRVLGDDAPPLALTLAALAEVHVARRELDEAEQVYRRALAIQRKRLAADHPNMIGPLVGLAGVLVEAKRHADALPIAREALAAFEQRFGPEHPTLGHPLRVLAEAERVAGSHAVALAIAERGVRVRAHADVRPFERAETKRVLADVLWDAPADRARARELVVAARAEIADEPGPLGVSGRAELDAWLAAHPL
ncbi:MAG TPA: serine/threonine-protein kinase [Nannocystaceae bacterium]|nr:serine/threonine-protein kinase [Nannocystaceae bacterium]